ncbi:hypothetical protein PSE10A_46380 [Pseudomonas amygdali pv. eriobotryae]|uniref:Uncharacterized protein n=1 Tax=Pseudomonas amygdali pv. eriobotryae TaxID=129137 RepID=A0A9P3AGW3_PSEA0|nr:hypothetical protein [Pseudomonas amygdali]GFZ62127.1 hypothetical protein PSE10A_46380 [Pseudomonas amygdali pv. eriobotryae]
MSQRNIYLKDIAVSIFCVSVCTSIYIELIPFLEIHKGLQTLLATGNPNFDKAIYPYYFSSAIRYLFLTIGSISALFGFIDLHKLVFSFTAKGKQLMAQAEANEAIRIAEEKIQSAQRFKEYQLREAPISSDERKSSSSTDSFMSPTSPVWSHSSSSSSSGGWSGGDSGSWSGGSCDSGSSGGGDCSGGGGGGD